MVDLPKPLAIKDVKCLNGYFFDRHVPFPMDMTFVVHVDATIFHSLIVPAFCDSILYGILNSV